ncbi:hypothetical protein GH810_05995 [Acetobacterium paludosum]|uniref:Uncharacterized protein n=1 Tax=Acetobacterium paludosum TaxID=52693 RepID=A0A923HSJ5_9FIRM|nr:hypothetical protein [Acetobacterium paludosum]MBC3887858.1 hypothetical protein [Acetobacterium paludosum]
MPNPNEQKLNKYNVIPSIVATSGSDDPLIGNCPACGFPRKREPKTNRSNHPNIGNCPVCHNELVASNHGYFVVYKDKDDLFDIAFQWIPAKSTDNSDDQTPAESPVPIPTAKQALFEKIVTANTIIKSLYFNEDTDIHVADHKVNDAIKKKYFKKLLSLAQAGLAGEMAQPALATSALERLKDEITIVEGQRIKNTYMKELGLRAFLSSLIALLLFLITSTAIFSGQATFADVFFKRPDTFVFFESGFLSVISMCSVIWIGAMLGTWVSFAARNPTFNFERLSILETDRMEPTIRLIYIGICAIIFSLFLSSGIVALEIAGFSTANINESISTQIVIGLLCGLTESKIGSFIHSKTEAVILKNNNTDGQTEESQPPK